MLFWIICAALSVVVGLIVATPLLRKTTPKGVDPDVAFYRAQLAELDRDTDRALITPQEASIARTEIARRLIAADTATPQFHSDKPAPVLGGVAVAIIAVFGLISYAYLGAPGYDDMPLKARIAASDDMRANRPSQSAMAAVALSPPPPDVTDEYMASINQLREIVPTQGDDLQGWSLLAIHEAQLRNYTAAADAQARVIALKGPDATIGDTHRLVDLLVAAAGGLVSPETETILADLFANDPNDFVARYYLGALYNQTDRPDVALRMWRPVVANGDPAAYHTEAARAQIEDAAFRAGENYTLPDLRGPTADDIANANDMSEADRTAMIANMVAGLSDRLATEGGPASDWARLITAYGVLGETDAATAIWNEARNVFAGSDSAIALLRTAANSAGIIE